MTSPLFFNYMHPAIILSVFRFFSSCGSENSLLIIPGRLLSSHWLSASKKLSEAGPLLMLSTWYGYMQLMLQFFVFAIMIMQVLMSVFVAFRLRFILFVTNNPLKVPTNRYNWLQHHTAPHAFARRQHHTTSSTMHFMLFHVLLQLSKCYRRSSIS